MNDVSTPLLKSVTRVVSRSVVPRWCDFDMKSSSIDSVQTEQRQNVCRRIIISSFCLHGDGVSMETTDILLNKCLKCPQRHLLVMMWGGRQKL